MSRPLLAKESQCLCSLFDLFLFPQFLSAAGNVSVRVSTCKSMTFPSQPLALGFKFSALNLPPLYLALPSSSSLSASIIGWFYGIVYLWLCITHHHRLITFFDSDDPYSAVRLDHGPGFARTAHRTCTWEAQ